MTTQEIKTLAYATYIFRTTREKLSSGPYCTSLEDVIWDLQTLPDGNHDSWVKLCKLHKFLSICYNNHSHGHEWLGSFSFSWLPG